MSAFDTDLGDDPELMPEETTPVLGVPTGGEDFDGAANAKDAANEAKSSGNYEQAIEFFTKALTLGSVSALTLAARADCLLKAHRPLAAISDCNAALKINPDSARALRCRGTAYRFIGKYDLANVDIGAAQQIDYNADIEPLRHFVHDKAAIMEAKKVQQRIHDEEILREKVKKQREEMAKRAQEEREEEERERAQQRAQGGGFGGMGGGFGGMGGMGGMGGGMGGMGGADGLQQMIMQLLMSDPELSAGLRNPKIMKAFTAMMGGGEPDMASMNDPEVKAFMDKFQEKLGPLMGMMGGDMGADFGEGDGIPPEEDDHDHSHGHGHSHTHGHCDHAAGEDEPRFEEVD